MSLESLQIHQELLAGLHVHDRRRLKRHDRRIAKPDQELPTLETLRKRRADTLDTLEANRRLTRAQCDAAREIRDVFEACCKGLFTRSRYDGMPRPKTAHQGLVGIEGMTARTYALYSDRYKPWHREVGRRAGLVMELVLENASINELAKRHKCRRETLYAALSETLWVYVELAGWGRKAA